MNTEPSTTFLYVEMDVPAGVTLSAWRGAKERAARRRRRPTLRLRFA
jgi:hypothetical protein